MQNLLVIEEIFGNKNRIKVLRALTRDTRPRSARELAREIGYSPTYVIEALRKLESLGILLRRRVGQASIYEMNEESYLYREMVSPVLAAERKMTPEIMGRFFDELGGALKKIIVFGSLARGEAGPDSDVDLILVVREDLDREDIEEHALMKALEASTEFGVAIEAFIFSESEYEKKLRSGKGMWEAIRREGIEIENGSEKPAAADG